MVDLKINSLKKSNVFFFVSCFLFYLFISYNTPLTGDDWTWGTERGILRLKSKFVDYNGRYVSNILEIILTRYEYIRYLTVAGLSSLLVYLVGKLTETKLGIASYLFSFTFFLLTNTQVFSQTFGWTAGFVNYVVSLVFLLIFLLLTKNIYQDSEPYYNRWGISVVIPLGIITPLFVEHVSLFSIFVALYVIIYTFLKFKKVYATHVAYFVSVLIGNVIMFSNTAYWNVVSGEDDYRTIREGTGNTGLFHKIYNVYSDNMYQYLFFYHPILNIFIGVLIIIIIVSVSHRLRLVNTLIKPILLSVVIGFLLYQIDFKSLLGNELFFLEASDFESLAGILFFVSILVTVFLFIDDLAVKSRLLFYLSGVILLTAPFIFVTPYGPRGVLASYLFLVLFGIELLTYCGSKLSWSTALFIKPLICATLILVVSYVNIFMSIGDVSRERLSYLELKLVQNEDTIYLPEIPYSQYLWMSSPPNEHFTKMFKRFNNVPKETEVIFVPYSKWEKEYKSMED